MKWNAAKKYGRRKAGTWGRTAKKYAKRVASKALRRFKP